VSGLKRLLDWLRRLVCTGGSGSYTASFTEDEAKRILEARAKLQRWLQLAQAGVIGAPAQGDIKPAIMDIVDAGSRLYEWYVPPFAINTATLSEQELQNVINDLRSKGGMQGWLRLDGNYYTVDMETFKKIVEWDWTDTRKYVLDRFDCDKFAIYFKARMAIDFGVNAVGVVLDYSAGHAYNLVILRDAQGVKWLLYEPQNDSIFTYEQRDKNLYAMQYYYLVL
jgi:hypothetical protein